MTLVSVVVLESSDGDVSGVEAGTGDEVVSGVDALEPHPIANRPA